MLSKIRKYITLDAANKIYKTMILPIVEYGDILYDGSNQKLLGNEILYLFLKYIEI